jgi:hypothetical protein
MKRWIVKAALLAVVAAAVVASGAFGSNAPVLVTFDKHVVDPVAFAFEGTAGGDVTGDLHSQLVSLSASSGPILQIAFDWTVSAGAKSFTARTEGIWNTKTGSVVMNGTVIDGYLLGAQVHEEGQLLDPATLHFAGTLQLMPASAG